MNDSAVTSPSTEDEPNLKGKNATYLWSFVSVNIAVFLCLLVGKGLTESSLDHFWQRVTMKDGIVIASVPIVALVLSGILGDVGKARLVFWRWTNPLPGCRVFSELLQTDSRIDVPALRSRLGEFPTEPHAQNALWFKLYRSHSAAPRVLQAHRNYLLTRDMATVAAVFAVLLATTVFVGPVSHNIAGLYAFALLLQYFMIATAARNYGNRFVLNVLSEELHT
jgi:hypothetical protein